MFNYKKVVLISPERLGDTIFYTPSIQLLKKHQPETEIDVIALSSLSASVLEHNPCINKIYIAPSQKQVQHLVGYYDIAINIHNNETARQYIEWLNVKAITEPVLDKTKHQSEQSLEFFQSFLDCKITDEDKFYTLFPQAEHFAKVKSLLEQQGVDMEKDILIGCHIGCHGIAKRRWQFWKPLTHPKVWPFEYFVQLEEKLRNYNPNIRFVLTGSKAEKRLGKKFLKAAPATINLINKTSVLDLASLMQTLRLFVTSDTGTLHVACASGVNLVALFGPTSLQRTGPYPMRSNYTILQAATMAEISVQQVYDAAIKYLDKKNAMA